MMPVRLRGNFSSPYGKRIAEGILRKRGAFECGDPNERCDVQLEELEEQRIQVTVTRLRPALDSGDWAPVGQKDNQYRKTFENSSVEDVTHSIARLIEARPSRSLAIATQEEFLAELSRIRERFDWMLQPDEGWLADRRAWLRFRVRGSSKTGPAEGIALDPIGAVCYAITRTLYEPDYWEEAVKTLGLPFAIGSDLMAAANDRTWKDIAGQRRPYQPWESLRKRLVETVGLELPARRL